MNTLMMSNAAVFGWLKIIIAIGLVWMLVWIAVRIISNILFWRDNALIQQAVGHLRRPVFWILLFAVLRFLLPLSGLPLVVMGFAAHVIAIGLIVGVITLLIKLADVLNDFILSRYDVSAADNLRARKIHTQLKVLKRIIIVIVCFVGFASILMTFEGVRQLGTSLMASAGIIGIIVGVAAQRTIHTFLTGIQIAFTQPIRLDDVVIVEGEWGRIEEITLTYVVVRIWDQRRLIVPITSFIEKPFQNWTRVSADILGTVFLYVDYTVPVEAVRKKLAEIAAACSQWDKKVCALQVTNATDKTVELRALVSASDASKAWELRCIVREKLIEFIREEYPDALPKLRTEFTQNPPV